MTKFQNPSLNYPFELDRSKINETIIFTMSIKQT
jgi:hypothetical protein